MAEFEPVGVRAVVEGAEKFIADLNRMTTAVIQFYSQAGRSGAVFQNMNAGTASAQAGIVALAAATNTTTASNTRMAASVQTAGQQARGYGVLLGGTRAQVELLGQRLAFLAIRNIENANSMTKAIASSKRLSSRLVELTAKKDSLLQTLAREQAAYNKIQSAQAKSGRAYQKTAKEITGLVKKINSLVAAQEKDRRAMANANKTRANLVNKLTKQENAEKKNENAIRSTKIAIDKARDSMANYQTKIDLTQKELNELGIAHVSARQSMVKHAASAVSYGRDLNEAGERVAGLSNEIGKIDKSIATIARLGKALAVLKTSFKAAAGAASLFGKALLLPQTLVKTLGRSLLRLSSRIDTVSRNWFKMGNSIRFFGMSMTFLVSLPILAFLGNITKSAIDFEDAFAGVIKTVDGLVVPNTLNELNAAGEALQRNFRNLALEIPVSAIELSKLGQVAGQLGVRGVGNITAFVNSVARIGAASDLSAEDAGRFLAQIIAIQGPMKDAQLTLAGFTDAEIANLTASEKFQAQIQAVGGTLIALGNNLPTTEEAIARFSQRISASGKLAHIATADIFGIGAAFASVGIPAERGGTAVQKTFIRIIESIQTGGSQLKLFADTADLSVEEFASAFAKGSDKAGFAFERFIRGLGDNGDKAILILDALDLNNQRVINSLLSVANAASTTGVENGRMAEAIEIANEAFKKFGNTLEGYNALQLESERRFATTASQIKLLKNQFTDLGITVGAIVLPTIRKFIDILRVVIGRIEQLGRTEGGKKMIVFAIGIALVTAALGPLIVAFGLVLSSIGFIGIFVAKLIGIFGTLFSSVGLLAAPILAVAAALIGLGIAFIASFKKIDQISGDAARGLIPAMWEFGKELILAFARGMAAAFGAVIQVLIAIGEILRNWLAPGSPPKIAPDLDKWGEKAMNTYLRGWLNADFNIFNEIANKVESFMRSISRDLGDALIPRIIGSRKAIAEAVNTVRETGKITEAIIKKITKAIGKGSGLFLDYIEALLEVEIASKAVADAQKLVADAEAKAEEETEKVTAAKDKLAAANDRVESAAEKVAAIQERLVAINKRYDKSLQPLSKRLEEISDRQREVANSQRIQELEQILIDPRATSLVRELAELEIEEIGLEKEVGAMEDARDVELERIQAKLDEAEKTLKARKSEAKLMEIAVEAAKKQLEAAEKVVEAMEKGVASAEKQLALAGEQVELAENMVDFQIKNNQLIEEYLSSLENAEKAAKGLGGALGDLLDGVGEKLDDLEFGELGDDLFEGLGQAIDETIQNISDSFNELVKELGGIFAPLIPMWERLGDVWAPIFETIIEKLNPLKIAVGGLKGAFDGVMESVGTLADELIFFLVSLGAIDMPASFMQSLEDAEHFKFVLDPVSAGGAAFDFDTQEFGQGLQDRAGEIRSAMDSPLAELGTRLAEPFERMKEAILEVAGIVNDTLTTAWRGVLRIVDEIVLGLIGAGVIDPFGKYVKIWEEIEGITEDAIANQIKYGEAIEAPDLTWLQKIGGFIEDFQDSDLVKAYSASFLPFFDQLLIISGDLEGIGEAFGHLGKALDEFFGVFGGSQADIAKESTGGGGFFSTLAFLINLVVSSVLGVIAGITRAVTAFITGIINFFTGLVRFVTGIFQLIKGIAQLIWAGFIALGSGPKAASDAITTALETMAVGVMNIIVGFIQALTGILLGLWEMVTGLFWGIVDTVVESWDYFYDALLGNSIIPDIVNGIIEWFTTLVSTVIEKVSAFIASVIEFFANLAATVIEKVSAFVTNVIEFWANLIETITEAVTQFVTDVIEFWTNLITDIIEAVTTFVSDIIEFWTTLITDVLEAIGTFVTDAIQFFSDMYDGIIEWFESLVGDAPGKIVEFATAIKDKILGFVEDATGWAGELAQGIIDGLVGGITDGITAVGDAIKDIAGGAIDKAKSIFGIDSPSKEFKEIGEQTLEGWIKGMEKQEKKLVKLMEDMVETLIEKAKDIFVEVKKIWDKGAAENVRDTKEWLSAIVDLSKAWANIMALNGTASIFGSAFDRILDWLEDMATNFAIFYKKFLDLLITVTETWANAMALNGNTSLFGSVFDVIAVALKNFWQDFMLVWGPFLLLVVTNTHTWAKVMALNGSKSLFGKVFTAILLMFNTFFVVFVGAIVLFLEAIEVFAYDLRQIFVDKKSDFRSAGENLINALAAGLQAAAGNLYNVAQGIANTVKSIINDAYEIKSPSRVFYKVGENIIEGWARGMEDNRDRLTGAMSTLAGSLANFGGQAQPASPAAVLGQQPASALPAPMPVGGSVTTAEINMGGQVLNNGIDTITLQIALEQALRNIL